MGIIENLAKNPAVLGIAAVGIIAFIFKDKISDFLSNISGGAETANLLGENLLSNLQGTQNLLKGVNDFFTNFEFPKFEFPTFEFPKVFAEAEPVGTPVDIALSEGATPSEIAAMLTPEEIALDPNQDPTKFLPPALPQGPTIIGTQPTSILDFVNNFLEPKAVTAVPLAQPISQLNLGQEQPFTLAPLGAQTLTSIIDQFDVTASQAANIKFISQQGGDPFADPSNIFGENPPAVSDPQFQGLTPEQIALKLTGGNISNF